MSVPMTTSKRIVLLFISRPRDRLRGTENGWIDGEEAATDITDVEYKAEKRGLHASERNENADFFGFLRRLDQ